MPQCKILKKDKVLTMGSSNYRAVLCYDSGLVYQYENPENILSIYDKNLKGWVTTERPYYSSGGWGSGSTGDALGHHLISNARQLIESIDGKILTLNQKRFMSNEDIKQYNREALKQNKMLQKMSEKFSERVSKFEPLKQIKIEARGYYRGAKKDKGTDVFKLLEKYDTALEVFLNKKGQDQKIDSYLVTKNQVSLSDKIVALYDKNGDITLNSEVLGITSFERSFLGSQSMIQKTLRERAKYSIPFNVLQAADLKLNQTKVIEQGPESHHVLSDFKRTERHFTGALLLENSGRKFLMDIDRLEIEHGIFNAFFVEVSPEVQSIAQAYESMKPKEVIEAEKNGITVLRQGEWFFIETDKTVKIDQKLIFQSDLRDDDKEYQTSPHVIKCNISHGKGRPNSLYKPVNFGDLDQYFCGVVRHSGREHKELVLKMKSEKEIVIETSEWNRSKESGEVEMTLYKVIGNTTVSNFTVTGEID